MGTQSHGSSAYCQDSRVANSAALRQLVRIALSNSCVGTGWRDRLSKLLSMIHQGLASLMLDALAERDSKGIVLSRPDQAIIFKKEDLMFTQKRANSTALRWGILLVVILALLVTMFAGMNASLASSSHPVQIAAAPVFSVCAPGPAYGSSPAAVTSSRLQTPLCPPSIQTLGSWGG